LDEIVITESSNGRVSVTTGGSTSGLASSDFLQENRVKANSENRVPVTSVDLFFIGLLVVKYVIIYIKIINIKYLIELQQGIGRD